MLLGIIQARMGSKRFPGKMLADLGDLKVIDWVLCRIQRSQLLRAVVLAIPDTSENDELAAIGGQYYMDVVRGPEEDVLTRFVQAAKKFKADHIVRICADNPFVDPDEIDRLIGWYFYKQPDYASNNNPRWGYSDGFGAEIFTMTTLKLLDQETKGSHREHVTSRITSIADHHFHVDNPAPSNRPDGFRFDVNTPEDLKHMNRLIPPVRLDSTMREIIEIAHTIW